MLSIPHMIVVFVIVLVVFGPQKLPELARGLGKLMAEFRKASTDFKSAFENEMRDLERQAAEVERKKRELLAAANAAIVQPATLATPSGAETQTVPAQLAAPVESEGAGQGPVITPVAESIARSTAADDANASPDASPQPSLDAIQAPVSQGSPGEPTLAETGNIETPRPALDLASENGHQSQAAAPPGALDAPHDYKPA
jgi:sec-independent protein translocase protein TatB